MPQLPSIVFLVDSIFKLASYFSTLTFNYLFGVEQHKLYTLKLNRLPSDVCWFCFHFDSKIFFWYLSANDVNGIYLLLVGEKK